MDLHQMAVRGFPEMSEEQCETLLCGRFVSGINHRHWAKVLLDGSNDNFAALVATAKQHEQTNADWNKLYKDTRSGSGNENSKNVHKRDPSRGRKGNTQASGAETQGGKDEETKSPPEGSGAHSQSRGRTSRSEITCFQCNKKGHYVRECYSKKKAEPPSDNSAKRESKPMTLVIEGNSNDGKRPCHCQHACNKATVVMAQDTTVRPTKPPNLAKNSPDTIEIYANGTPVEAFLDTGAMISLVGESVAKHWQDKKEAHEDGEASYKGKLEMVQVPESERMSIRMATGHQATLNVRVEQVPVQVDGRIEPVDFWVVGDEAFSQDLLLGKPAMTTLGFDILRPSGSFMWHKEDWMLHQSMPPKWKSKVKFNLPKVSLPKRRHLPPNFRSSTLVGLTIDSNLEGEENQLYMLEPDQEWMEVNKVMVVPALLQKVDGMWCSQTEMINWEPHSSVVPSGVIGTLVPVTKADLPVQLEEAKASTCPLIIGDAKERLAKLIVKLDWSDSEATKEQKQRFITEVLKPYLHILSLHDDEVGEVSGATFEIDTSEDEAVQQKPRRLDPLKREKIDKEVERLLRTGRIAPANGEWSSPIVAVKKPDGSIHLCVDYRKLNAVTKRDMYPLPRIEDLVHGVGQTKIKFLSSMDVKSGYHQIPVSVDSQDKTAFIYAGGLYKFLFMPFGVKNAPAVFQRFMDNLLRSLPREKVGVYIDDILMKDGSFEEHLETVKMVLERLASVGMMVNVEKCKFLRSKIAYLGFELSADGLRPGIKKVKAVQEFPKPKDVHGIRMFHGLLSYFRKFMPGFSEEAEPLTRLLRKDEKFVWGPEQQKAFENLKRILAESITLLYPDPSKPFIINTDASRKGLGVCVSQVDPESGKERPVAFASRTLNPAEKRYSPTELEGLAVLYALDYFRFLILGKDLIVRTDHRALRELMDCTNPKHDRLYRWRMRLLEYENKGSLKLEYKPGRTHQAPDALSRCPVDEAPEDMEAESTSWLYSGIPVFSVAPAIPENLSELLKFQENDSKAEAMKQWLENKILPEGDPALRSWVLAVADTCVISAEGLLYRLTTDRKTGEVCQRLYVADTLREALLHEMHSNPISGHSGVEKMLFRLEEKYYWPSMRPISCDSTIPVWFVHLVKVREGQVQLR